jgi:hypothetical protein
MGRQWEAVSGAVGGLTCVDLVEESKILLKKILST